MKSPPPIVRCACGCKFYRETADQSVCRGCDLLERLRCERIAKASKQASKPENAGESIVERLKAMREKHRKEIDNAKNT